MGNKSETVLFTKDKPIIGLVSLSGLLSLATVLSVLIRLKSHDFKVPVQYIVNDGSVLQTSNWYTLYSLALFSVAGTVAAIFLSHRIYKSNRVFAVGTLIAFSVVQIVTLIVVNALLGLVGRV